MAEQEATATEAAPSENTGEATEDASPTETVDFWKSKAREQEKRAKANAAAAKKLADLEESQKTEQQKISDQFAAEKSAREQAEAAALRYRVALSKGISADLIDRLRGDSEEELEADADQLLKLVSSSKDDDGTAPGPRPDLSQGATGGSGTSTADQFAAAIGGEFTT